jgi:hypothetical protein
MLYYVYGNQEAQKWDAVRKHAYGEIQVEDIAVELAKTK